MEELFLRVPAAKSTKIDKAWAIIDHFEGEDQNCIIKKSEPERDVSDNVFTKLISLCGTRGNRLQVRQTFVLQIQQKIKLDATPRFNRKFENAWIPR